MSLLLLSTASAAPAPATAAELEVIEALAVRHDPPPCATLAARLPTPALSLTRIAEHTNDPPWVGMRAAACLLEVAPAAVDTYRRWLTEPGFAGLGRLVLPALDTLDEPVAVDLAEAAMAGPLAAKVHAWLPTSAHPGCRALQDAR